MIHQNVPASLLNKRIIALDIETTGLDIQKNTIIELGVVEIVNGKVTTEYKKLFGGGHSSMHLVRCVHHIADGERAGKKTFRECAQKIASYLSNAIVVTHNGNAFDIPMIEWNLRQAGAEWKNYKSVDTLAIMRKYRKANDDETDEKKEKVQGRNKLGNICKEFGLVYGGEDGGNAHRGLEDAEACLDLLFYLVNNNKIELSV